MAVYETIGLQVDPTNGWPVNLPPLPNPGTTAGTYKTNDRAFVHGRDYRLKTPESYTGAWTAESSSYVRVYELLPDNIYDADGVWAGRHAYVSKRREWIFAQELLGYPFISNGLLYRKLPEPLTWGGTLNGSATNPPFYPHNTIDPWTWPDTRHAVKFTGTISGSATTITGPSSTTGLIVGMAIEGPNIPDGTTILTVTPSLTISQAASASGTSITFWAYAAVKNRYTHWATAIKKVEGVGEMLQCPDAGTGATFIQFRGTVTSGSPNITGIVAEDGLQLTTTLTLTGLYDSSSPAHEVFPAATTIFTVTTVSGVVTAVAASANSTRTGTFTFGASSISSTWSANESYKRLRFSVLFERVNFEQMLAYPNGTQDLGYGGEWSRNVLYQDDPQGRFVQTRGGVKWDGTDGYGQPVAGNRMPNNSDAFAYDEGLPKLIGENMILWKWLDVPLQAYSWSRIQSYFGSVNNGTFPPSDQTAPFFTMGKETCLLRSVGRQQKNNTAGPPLWDLTFCFHYSPAPDGLGYWNRLLSNKGYYQRYYSASSTANNFYTDNDFTKLFTAG